MQELVLAGKALAPSKPTLEHPLPLLIDPLATVPTERYGVLAFILIGKPWAPRIACTRECKHAAATALAHAFYLCMSLPDMSAGLRQLEQLTKARSRVQDGDQIAKLYRQELRIVPAWLLRKAATAHVRESRWFPTIAELLACARVWDAATVSATERLWRIAEAPLN